MNVASYIIANDGGIFSKYKFGEMKQIPTDSERSKLKYIYGAHLILNFIWTPIFMGKKKLGLAFLDILAVLGCIVYLQINYSKYNDVAGKLFIPYVMWVSFASYLSFYAWINNKPKSQ